MKFLMTLIAALLALPAFAATRSFTIDSEISTNGKVMCRPRITSLPNQSAKVSQKDDDGKYEATIEVTAIDAPTAQAKGAIEMKLKVTYIKDENKTVISRRIVVAQSGQAAEFNVGENGNADALRIKITPTRQE